MAWIKVIEPNEATGELKRLYNHVTKGEEDVIVDNILTIHSLHPKTLEAHLMIYEELMHGENNLSKQQREMIGVVVSSLNQCVY
ncbi:MAG: peroxidase [Clostridia bacterium]|nr:peroxidase [Clostridia bacterium]